MYYCINHKILSINFTCLEREKKIINENKH